MWAGGDAVFLVAMIAAVVAWLRAEEAEGRRVDALLDHQEDRHARRGSGVTALGAAAGAGGRAGAGRRFALREPGRRVRSAAVTANHARADERGPSGLPWPRTTPAEAAPRRRGPRTTREPTTPPPACRRGRGPRWDQRSDPRRLERSGRNGRRSAGSARATKVPRRRSAPGPSASRDRSLTVECEAGQWRDTDASDARSEVRAPALRRPGSHGSPHPHRDPTDGGSPGIAASSVDLTPRSIRSSEESPDRPPVAGSAVVCRSSDPWRRTCGRGRAEASRRAQASARPGA